VRALGEDRVFFTDDIWATLPAMTTLRYNLAELLRQGSHTREAVPYIRRVLADLGAAGYGDAMLKMVKLDIAELVRAAASEARV